MTDTLTDTIDLARAPELRIGRLRVRPAYRQLIHDSGRTEVLEPRVMQVLLALANANGGIVTRDDLSRTCWDRRVVGEDAVNRVISRLRKSADGIGIGSFSIETITKVGYRLRCDEPIDAWLAADARPAQASSTSTTAPPSSVGRPLGPSRRALLAAGAGGFAAIAAGAGWWWTHRTTSPPSRQAAELLKEGINSIMECSHEGQLRAIGLLQRLVAEHPSYADGWGALGYAYACAAGSRPVAEAEAMRVRGRAAVARAKALDADNVYAEVAAATLPPGRGTWLASDRALRAALQRHPGNDQVTYALGEILCQTGRHNESVALFDRVRRDELPTPGLYYCEILALWGADRLEEADALATEGANLYPTQFAIWFFRVYSLMYGGRAATAIGMLRDVSTRPSGIPSEEFAKVEMVARALVSRAKSDIDAAMAIWLERTRLGAGYAENTIQFASGLGRIDEAFAVADAYYFGLGFTVPEVRFAQEQGSYTPMAERGAAFLFYPSTAPMRADPRFAALVEKLGLGDYWRSVGAKPDYLRAG